MCLSFVRVIALTVAFVGFLLISGVLVLVGRCGAAAWDYIAESDGDTDVADVLTSDEFLDFAEKSYWIWGLLLAAVVWGTLLFVFIILCSFRWSISVLFQWFCCDLPCYKWTGISTPRGTATAATSPPPVVIVTRDGGRGGGFGGGGGDDRSDGWYLSPEMGAFVAAHSDWDNAKAANRSNEIPRPQRTQYPESLV